jgi:hypothetical protein
MDCIFCPGWYVVLVIGYETPLIHLSKHCRITSNYLRDASLERLIELEGGLRLCASPRRLCVKCSALLAKRWS